MAWKLNTYFAKIFSQCFLVVFAVIALGCFLLTLGETFDENFVHISPSNAELLLLAFYKVPDLLQKIMPMITLLTAMTYFVLIARSRQFLMAQQVGKSLLKLSILPLCVTLSIGLLSIFVLNPVTASLLERHENFIKQNSHRAKSILSVADTGIWLRQNVDKTTLIIRAKSFNNSDKTFHDLSIFAYEGVFKQRFEARWAEVADDFFVLHDVLISPVNGLDFTQKKYSLKARIDEEKIHESFQEVRTISIYKLQGFITAIENAGFSANEHLAHFHGLLSSPIILLSMFLLAGAICAHTHHRRFPHWEVLSTLIIGLVYFVFLTTFQSIGLSKEWPLLFTIWIPHLLFLSLLLTYILHSESLRR